MTRRPSASIEELDDLAEALAPDEGESVTLEEVRTEGRRRSVTLSARFNPVDVARIRAVAEREGVGATQLVRTWVLEALESAEEVEDAEVDEPAMQLMAALELGVTAAKEAQRAARAELRRLARSGSHATRR